MTDTPEVSAQETFTSHLVELRDRLLRAIIAVVVVMLALFPWAKDIYAILAKPLLAVLPAGASMVATHLPGPFPLPPQVNAQAAVGTPPPPLLRGGGRSRRGVGPAALPSGGRPPPPPHTHRRGPPP